MYDVILVPTDGSDHARRAAEYGALLARTFDASLHVISVVDTRSETGPFDAGGLDDADIERLEAGAEQVVGRALSEIAVPDETRTAVRRGVPREAILEYARENGADLIAMGTQGRTGVDRYVAGSVAEGVVRHARVPVLTVRAAERTADPKSIDELLVPTDGSECAERAVDHAIALAEAFDARVHAIYVLNVGKLATSPEFTPPSSLLNDLESQGEAATERIAARAREAGLEAMTSVLSGVPAAKILDYADEHAIDMIAMGTAGRTGLNRFLVGSTAERVIRHAAMPVVAVNARDRADRE